MSESRPEPTTTTEPHGIAHADLPRDDEPGGESTPLDTEGAGPVGLEDRTRTDEKGSPATNQGKAEPIPPTPGHGDPAAPAAEPPTLAQMNVGAADPQAPSHPAVSTPPGPLTGAPPTALGGPGAAPAESRPLTDPTTATGLDLGPEKPYQHTDGTSHRAPGMVGATGSGEAVDSDVHAGAARMQGLHPADSSTPDMSVPADTGGVPSSGGTPAPGTSEELTAVRGTKLPDADEATRSS
jgi:hypothetical protein